MPRVTVGPKSDGGSQVTGEPGSYGTQAEAVSVARPAADGFRWR
jgi:hypothetical protein